MMADRHLWERYLPELRIHLPHVPPPRVPEHIPLLRGNTYNTVNNYLNSASRTMANLGVEEWGPHHDPGLFWQALGTNKKRWPGEIRNVWTKREDAMRVVANELDYQLPGFQGLESRFSYQPHKIGRFDAGETDMTTGRVRIGDWAFQSPAHLLNVMMHEGRHSWQVGQEGLWKSYAGPSALADGDAYLFDMEHRRLSGIEKDRLAFTLGQFKRLCDIDDRLRARLPVEARFTDPKGRWGITEMMDPVRRADLELRYSFIESDLRRELSAPTYSRLWSTLPRTFSYQPITSPSASYNSGSSFLRGLWH